MPIFRFYAPISHKILLRLKLAAFKIAIDMGEQVCNEVMHRLLISFGDWLPNARWCWSLYRMPMSRTSFARLTLNASPVMAFSMVDFCCLVMKSWLPYKYGAWRWVAECAIMAAAIIYYARNKENDDLSGLWFHLSASWHTSRLWL